MPNSINYFKQTKCSTGPDSSLATVKVLCSYKRKIIQISLVMENKSLSFALVYLVYLPKNKVAVRRCSIKKDSENTDKKFVGSSKENTREEKKLETTARYFIKYEIPVQALLGKCCDIFFNNSLAENFRVSVSAEKNMP